MGLARTVALVLGAVYLLVGVIGFIVVPGGEGHVAGLFPVNWLHNIVHILIGAALLYGATSTGAAIVVSRIMGILLVVISLLGVPFPDGFGLLPIGGADILLHLGSGVVLLYIGFMAPVEAPAF